MTSYGFREAQVMATAQRLTNHDLDYLARTDDMAFRQIVNKAMDLLELRMEEEGVDDTADLAEFCQ